MGIFSFFKKDKTKPVQVESPANNVIVYCTKSRKTYHSITFCRYVSGAKLYKLNLQDAKRRGMQPCSECCQHNKFR